MIIDDQIKNETLQYGINRDAAKITTLSSGKISKYESAKISALSSGKISTYEYVTGEVILPSNQRQIIKQAKFTYSPRSKSFEKQTKTIEDQGQKQIDALKNLKSNTQELTIKNIIPEDVLNDEAKNELSKIKEIE